MYVAFRFLDPIFFGDYPREMREILSSNLPKFTPEKKKLLQNNKVDFIGINHYTAIYAKDCIYSPCTLDTYEGNALVYAIGRRNGKIIGKPVRTTCLFFCNYFLQHLLSLMHLICDMIDLVDCTSWVLCRPRSHGKGCHVRQ